MSYGRNYFKPLYSNSSVLKSCIKKISVTCKISLAYLKSLSKFIRHQIVKNRIYACGNIIKDSGDVCGVCINGWQGFAILIFAISHIHKDNSLDMKWKMEKLTVIFLHYPHKYLMPSANAAHTYHQSYVKCSWWGCLKLSPQPLVK